MTHAYLEALKTATEELTALAAQKTELDQRTLHVRQTIATLMRLVGAKAVDGAINKGISDAIRDAIQFGDKQPKRLNTPLKLKLFLETIGYDFTKYKNPVASIAGTLEQMATRGEVIKYRWTNEQGTKQWAYRWKDTPPEEKPGGEKK